MINSLVMKTIILGALLSTLGALSLSAEPEEKSAGRTKEQFEAMKAEIANLKDQVTRLEKALQEMKAAAGQRKDNQGPIVDEELSAWLRKCEPQPSTSGKALATLEQRSNRAAKHHDLEIKRITPLAPVKGKRYHLARLEIEVRGQELDLYKWLDHLQAPKKLRAITKLRISPARNDDTLVVCLIRLEQWHLTEAKALPENLATVISELGPILEVEHYPVEVLLQIAIAGSSKELHLDRIEIQNQLGDDGAMLRSIHLHGRSPALAVANDFSEKLKKSKALRYAWETPAPHQIKDHWAFVFAGIAKTTK